jgi:hypothetical protein
VAVVVDLHLVVELEQVVLELHFQVEQKFL